MIRILIDTTVFIDHIRNKGKVTGFLNEYGWGARLSYITWGELLQGARSKRHLQEVSDIISAHEVVWGSPEIERLAIELLKHNLKVGMNIYDALIAATAIENNLILVTHNVKHFRGVAGLEVMLPPYLTPSTS